MNRHRCPYCHSTDILPFEDEGDYESRQSLWVVIGAGLVLFAGYFLFLVVSYLTFPLIVISALILSSKVINRRIRKSPGKREKKGYYICLDCRETFRLD